jgi:hypothetical protein
MVVGEAGGCENSGKNGNSEKTLQHSRALLGEFAVEGEYRTG